MLSRPRLHESAAVAPTVRLVGMEQDPDTLAFCVLDIIEYEPKGSAATRAKHLMGHIRGMVQRGAVDIRLEGEHGGLEALTAA